MKSDSKSQPAQASGADAKAKPDPRPGTDDKGDLKTLPLAEVEKRLESSPDGLTGAEAAKRLAKDGPNELKEKKRTRYLNFSSTFGDPYRG
jgi:H+-transporting ATPase